MYLFSIIYTLIDNRANSSIEVSLSIGKRVSLHPAQKDKRIDMKLFTDTTSTVNSVVIGKTITTQVGNPGEQSYSPAKALSIIATFDQQWGEKPTDGNKCAVCIDEEMFYLIYFSADDELFERPGACTNARRKGGVGGSMGLKGAIASFGLNS